MGGRYSDISDLIIGGYSALSYLSYRLALLIILLNV